MTWNQNEGHFSAPAVYVIHENEEWLPPFREAFERQGVPLIEWNLTEGSLDLDEEPPQGVFWSRMSASSQTRNHPLAKELTRSVLSWLEAYGRRTINGRRAIEIEMSKVHQLSRLKAHGILVPRTFAVVGARTEETKQRLIDAAKRVGGQVVIKHNQGGKGLGVKHFDSAGDLADYVHSTEFDQSDEYPVDGTFIVQEYVRPAEGYITRAEFVGGRFIYALKADTTIGGFQLCPADACAIDLHNGGMQFCPVAETIDVNRIGLSTDTHPEEIQLNQLDQQPVKSEQSVFSLREGFDLPIIGRYEQFLHDEGIEISGIEFIEDDKGRLVTYDVNTNTNYNSAVEQEVKNAGLIGGPDSIARFTESLLFAQYANVSV